MLQRAFDRAPIACHIYVTDQCNLDCHYCTEYDNAVPHPSLEDLKRRIRKARDLGCLRVGLQGGEPLLHPDIVEVVRYCKEVGLWTSLSTNGFRLTPELVRGLEAARLDALQVSVDRMTPIPSTRKALRTVLPKLEHLRGSSIPVHLSGVLFGETLSESREVLDYGLSRGIPTHTRLAHAGPDGGMRVAAGQREALASFLDAMADRKRRGERVHTTAHILDYQKSLLNGEGADWTCLAGYKYFFVSAKGEFWLCSMNRRPAVDFMSVTPELLRGYFHKKACQEGCGVYCIVETSMFCNRPFRFLWREGRDLLRRNASRIWDRPSKSSS
jgi:MoaA/NifB/PqqE/SkfB family radical SAM enzyme